jgi:hypothetical protein
MSKRKRKVKAKKIRNPVAKFFNQINKPSVEQDKTKYSRKRKHKGEE